jgi:hypothetical protein
VTDAVSIANAADDPVGQAELVDMHAERVVTDLTSRSLEDAKPFRRRVLGLEPVMDHRRQGRHGRADSRPAKDAATVMINGS